jgi:hypothetical protein
MTSEQLDQVYVVAITHEPPLSPVLAPVGPAAAAAPVATPPIRKRGGWDAEVRATADTLYMLNDNRKKDFEVMGSLGDGLTGTVRAVADVADVVKMQGKLLKKQGQLLQQATDAIVELDAKLKLMKKKLAAIEKRKSPAGGNTKKRKHDKKAPPLESETSESSDTDDRD